MKPGPSFMHALPPSAVLLVLAATAQGAPFVAAEGGLVVWPETSNSDQLEADSASGVIVGRVQSRGRAAHRDSIPSPGGRVVGDNGT